MSNRQFQNFCEYGLNSICPPSSWAWRNKMCKFNPKNDSRRIDPCMRNFIKWLNNKHKTISCCCGHGKYPMSVIVKEYVTSFKQGKGEKREIVFREIISGMILRVKKDPLSADPKKFYKKDKQGVYYIPEIIEQLNRKEGKLKC